MIRVRKDWIEDLKMRTVGYMTVTARIWREAGPLPRHAHAVIDLGDIADTVPEAPSRIGVAPGCLTGMISRAISAMLPPRAWKAPSER